MIIGIVGKLGEGKTLLLTILAYISHKKGSVYTQNLLLPRIKYFENTKNIFSNYFLNFDYVPVLEIEDIDSIKSGCVFLDEFWLWCDSRASGSAKNKAISNIAMISRKRNVNIFYTTQSFGKIDKRIRQITDYVLIPEFDILTGFLNVRVCEPVQNTEVVLKEFCLNAKPFFKLYDTKEEIGHLNENKNSRIQKK